MERKWLGRYIFIVVIVGLWFLFLYMAGIRLGLDLQGGFELIYRVEPRGAAAQAPIEEVVRRTIEVLERRVNALGLKDIYISAAGADGIVVDLPGGTEADKASVKELIEKAGVLEFRLVAEGFTPWSDKHTSIMTPREKLAYFDEKRRNEKMLKEIKKEIEEARKAGKPPKYELLPRIVYTRDRQGKIVPAPPQEWPLMPVETAEDSRVSGTHLERAWPSYAKLGQLVVAFKFDAEGGAKFYRVTSRCVEHEKKKNKPRYLAIVLDGVVYSAPHVRSAIYRSGIIEGRFTREEVERLVATLQGGALVGRLVPEGEFQVGPTLGEHAVKLGIIAIIVALGAVLVFMGFYYLAAGLVADIAMLANFILIAGTLAVSEATFTLPGLAGLVLTVGMAVDANILIFERVREERKGGKSLRQSLELGFKRAFWTIFDANITTLLTAIILMMAGTGPVKGFAVVLAIGIACTMFSALFISHTLLNSLADKKIVRDYKMRQIVKEPKYDFVRWTKPAVTVSTILVVAGIVLFFLRGRKVYGIEFTGGIHYQVCLIKPTTVAEIRKRLAKTNLFEDLKVTAAYTGLPNEDPKHGLSSQFVVKARLKEGARQQSDTKAKSQAEAVSNEVKKALAGLLAPEGFPSSEELKNLQKSYAEQGKVVFDVVVKAKKNLKERLKTATMAALKKIGKLQGDPKIEVTPLPHQKAGLEGELASLFKAFRVETKRKAVLRVRTASGDWAEAKPQELLIKIRKPLIEELRPSKNEPSLVPTQFVHKQDIGPAVASNLKAKAFVALLLAMIAIVIYIGIRFELIYGVAAVVALVHDVCVALGVGLLFDMLGIIEYKLDLAVIAAFLTIVGYSLNDTIVVFDRIREMLRRRRFAASQRGKLSEIINTSINACLSRTLLTSFTTFLAIFVLFIFGVKSLQGFTFTMLVGVVVGTYSSIYIASPILLLMRGETGEPKPTKAAKKTPDMVYLKETQKKAKTGRGKKGRKR